MKTSPEEAARERSAPHDGTDAQASDSPKRPREVGGPSGPEPTRYGDWEKRGRCIDF